MSFSNPLIEAERKNITRTVKKFKLQAVREKTYKYESVAPVRDLKNVEEFLTQHFSTEFYEHFVVIALNSANKIIGTHVIEGTTDSCAVYAKNIFSFLLLCGAISFIIAHNHPAGTKVASEADWAITNKLHIIGKNLELNMLDHLILTENGNVSLRQSHNWPV